MLFLQSQLGVSRSNLYLLCKAHVLWDLFLAFFFGFQWVFERTTRKVLLDWHQKGAWEGIEECGGWPSLYTWREQSGRNFREGGHSYQLLKDIFLKIFFFSFFSFFIGLGFPRGFNLTLLDFIKCMGQC